MFSTKKHNPEELSVNYLFGALLKEAIELVIYRKN